MRHTDLLNKVRNTLSYINKLYKHKVHNIDLQITAEQD